MQRQTIHVARLAPDISIHRGDNPRSKDCSLEHLAPNLGRYVRSAYVQPSRFLQAVSETKLSRNANVTYTRQECSRLRLQPLQKHASKSWAAMATLRVVNLQNIYHSVAGRRDTRVETLAGHVSTEMPYHAECVLEYTRAPLQIVHRCHIHNLK